MLHQIYLECQLGPNVVNTNISVSRFAFQKCVISTQIPPEPTSKITQLWKVGVSPGSNNAAISADVHPILRPFFLDLPTQYWQFVTIRDLGKMTYSYLKDDLMMNLEKNGFVCPMLGSSQPSTATTTSTTVPNSMIGDPQSITANASITPVSRIQPQSTDSTLVDISPTSPTPTTSMASTLNTSIPTTPIVPTVPPTDPITSSLITGSTSSVTTPTTAPSTQTSVQPTTPSSTSPTPTSTPNTSTPIVPAVPANTSPIKVSVTTPKPTIRNLTPKPPTPKPSTKLTPKPLSVPPTSIDQSTPIPSSIILPTVSRNRRNRVLQFGVWFGSRIKPTTALLTPVPKVQIPFPLPIPIVLPRPDSAAPPMETPASVPNVTSFAPVKSPITSSITTPTITNFNISTGGLASNRLQQDRAAIQQLAINFLTHALDVAIQVDGTMQTAFEQIEMIECLYHEEILGGVEDYSDFFRDNYGLDPDSHPRCYDLIQKIQMGGLQIQVANWRSLFPSQFVVLPKT